MQHPDGFNDESGRVCRLRKSFCGLKQAPRCWNKRFGEFLLKRGFQQSEADLCVFIHCKGHEKIIIALYADDRPVAATSNEEARAFIDELTTEFKITAKEASFFLGLEIKRRSDGSIKISQEGYTRKLLERFGMSDCRPVSTPMVAELGNADLQHENPNQKLENHNEQFSYRSAVGGLLYLSTGSRPDIAYATGVVSRILENPRPEDYVRLKRIFRNLQGTKEQGIVYQSNHNKGSIDADHGGDKSTGRSTSGVLCLYAGEAVFIYLFNQHIA
jgi:hypothetical protein